MRLSCTYTLCENSEYCSEQRERIASLQKNCEVEPNCVSEFYECGRADPASIHHTSHLCSRLYLLTAGGR